MFFKFVAQTRSRRSANLGLKKMTISDQIGYDDTKRQPRVINPKKWIVRKNRRKNIKTQEIKKDDNTNLVSSEWTSRKFSVFSSIRMKTFFCFF